MIPLSTPPAPLSQADEAESGALRAALLGAVRRLTPYTMACNLGSGALVLQAFRDAVPAGLWAWWAVLNTVSLLALWGWWRQRQRAHATASMRAMHRVTVHSAVLATLWALVPVLWFPQAQPAQQLLIATLVTGMLGAGGFVLSPVPAASLVWVCATALGALIALWRDFNPDLLPVAMLVLAYAPMVAIGAQSAGRLQARMLLAQWRTERQERMLTVLLQDFEQQADDVLWQTGADGHLSHQAPRLGQLLGLPDAALTAQPLLALLRSRTRSGLDALQQALNAGRPFRDLVLSLDSAAGPRHLAMQGKRLVDEQGRTLGWRGVVSDITAQVVAQQQLHALAHTDSLTGLANRHTLREALATTLQQGEAAALLSLDLDHFKSINDTLGHTAGDQLLQTVAQRLREVTRPGDLVARLGGDEFSVLLAAPIGPAEVDALARRLVASLAQPVLVQGRHLQVGASVGVVRCDGSAEGVDDLLVRADLALYAAKDGGRGRHAVYTPTMGARSRRRLALEQGLRDAVDRGELALLWQPKVDIAGWHIVGAEALLRWQHPQLGAVAPAEFIPVAEQCGLIAEIGHWVLAEACRAASGPLAGLVVSVNVSPVQLRDAHALAVLREALLAARLPPGRLELEITESVFIGDSDGVLDRLHALRALGVRVALDDFGTGYSSLAYLRRFPFDTLKIDRAFVSEVLLRADARAIVHTIAQLAGTLGMRTVSEGVETAAQLAAVRQAGCHEVQGYLVSPPLPLDRFRALRAGWTARQPAALEAG